MSNIDLSQAKIGDKFRTELGYTVTFKGLYKHGKRYKYMFERVDDRYSGCCCDINGVPYKDKEMYTIAEQVFDKPLDEQIKEATKQFRENDDVITEENELQRRQEVLKYADMLFFNQKDTRIALFGYDVAIETAEIIVKSRDKYLKDGKLC